MTLNNLSIPSWLIIIAHWETPMNPTTIYKKYDLTGSHTYSLIKKLQKKDIIKLMVDKKDKRTKYYTLTEKGIEIKENLSNVFKQISYIQKESKWQVK